MNINNINTDVATMEPALVDDPVLHTTPNEIDSTSKTEKPKNFSVLKEQKADAALQQKEPLSAEETEQITSDLNEYMGDLQTNLRFSMYEKLDHQVVVEIKNRQTDEVIKQIPSEELLELRVKMEELTGLIFDETI